MTTPVSAAPVDQGSRVEQSQVGVERQARQVDLNLTAADRGIGPSVSTSTFEIPALRFEPFRFFGRGKENPWWAVALTIANAAAVVVNDRWLEPTASNTSNVDGLQYEFSSIAGIIFQGLTQQAVHAQALAHRRMSPGFVLTTDLTLTTEAVALVLLNNRTPARVNTAVLVGGSLLAAHVYRYNHKAGLAVDLSLAAVLGLSAFACPQDTKVPDSQRGVSPGVNRDDPPPPSFQEPSSPGCTKNLVTASANHLLNAGLMWYAGELPYGLRPRAEVISNRYAKITGGVLSLYGEF